MNTRKMTLGGSLLQKQKFAAIALSLLAAPLALAQSAAPEAAPAAASSKEEETIELSPFVVDTTKDTGYYAENTLAGSRMNSNLSDLAASISVVTKQQMEDTASLDINDVFRYEVGTEGSATYTPQVIDRNTFKDTISGYTLGNDGGTTTNAQSNRVRGLATPEASLNYFQTNSRIPLDAYNTQSIEISRGPNSMLFGLGSPAGIVNQTATQASVNKESGQIQVRFDHRGSLRESLGFNKVLIKGKLGIYGSALYNKQQFERKPSHDTTKRAYGALTYKPFKKTTIRAFAESYSNSASRANSVTPRDYVTSWYASGRPAYDPVTRTVTILDTGVTTGPYATVTTSPFAVTRLNSSNKATLINDYTSMSSKNSLGSQYWVSGIVADNLARALIRIDGNNQVDAFARQPQFFAPAQTSPVTATPSGTSLAWAASNPRWAVMDQGWTSSTGLLLNTTASSTSDYYGTYYYSGVTDKKIYDWTKYNINQANFSKLRAGTYNVELEQEILPNLFFNAAWLRQDIDSIENNTISQTNGATIAIDTNTRLPDGSINPYFGLPFISDGPGPDTFYQPQVDDNARAMLAYNLDFTRKNNWMKWLGNHRLLGMWSAQKTTAAVERWRNGYYGGDAEGVLRYNVNTAVQTNAVWSGNGLSRYYYLASPGDAQGTVTHSSGGYGNQGWNSIHDNNIRVYDYTSNTWKYVDVKNTLLFADNGSYRRQRKLSSSNFAAQSNFFEDRIITTFGSRTDHLSLRRTQTGAYVDADGQTVAALTNTELFGGGGLTNYDLVMNKRWTAWEKINDHSDTKGVVIRPLKGWKFTSGDSFFAEALNGLSFHYNESGNFNPPANSQTDFFKNPLPKPEGTGKDYGFGFTVLKNKLVGRVTWFETQQVNDRSSTAGTLLTRLAYQDTTLMYNWAASIVRIRNGANPLTEAKWNDNTVHSVDDAASQAAITKLMGIPYNYFSGTSIAGTQTSNAKGVEAQLTYNPMPNWTIKLTASKQETIYDDVAPEYDAWLNYRMATWKSATSEIADFTDINGAAYSLKNFWTSYGYSSAAKSTNTDGNTNAGNYFNNTIASQEATARALEGAVSPQQSKYRGSLVTNYNFTSGKLKGWGVGMAERYQSAAAIGYYGKKADPTRPTLIGSIDITRPIYTDPEFHTDLWISYSTKICSGKFGLKVQLNVADVTENGGLKALAVNYDGTPWSYRIIDSRQFMLTTTLSF